MCRYAQLELDHFNVNQAKQNILDALELINRIEAIN